MKSGQRVFHRTKVEEGVPLVVTYQPLLIDKTDPTNSLQRENYWKHTLKIFAPYGLNIKENV